jgi:hypothetical protein
MKTRILLPGHCAGRATGTGIRALIIGVALCSSLFALCPAASAAEQKVSKKEAYELYVALSAVDGVDADNTVKAADNLLALRPVIESYEARIKALERAAYKAKLAARKDPKLLETLEERLLDYTEQIEAEAAAPVAVTLQGITLKPDEITAAKLRPAHLAILRRLEPKKDKPAGQK